MEPEKGPLEKEQYLHTTDFGVPALSLLGFVMKINSSVSFYVGRCVAVAFSQLERTTTC